MDYASQRSFDQFSTVNILVSPGGQVLIAQVSDILQQI